MEEEEEDRQVRKRGAASDSIGRRGGRRKSRRLRRAGCAPGRDREGNTSPAHDSGGTSSRGPKTPTERGGGRDTEVIVVEGDDEATADKDLAARALGDQELIQEPRNRQADLQLEVTQRLLQRVDAYVDMSLDLQTS